jgi:hypothetical protein
MNRRRRRARKKKEKPNRKNPGDSAYAAVEMRTAELLGVKS